MPPRPRKAAPTEAAEPEVLPDTDGAGPAATTAPDPAPDPAVDEEQPCTECFPQGWPAEDATSAGCGHGTWQR